MKPIRLELYEFGPYKNEVIEWEKIINEPMFLITGKTGSGKSTLFDAITYALYNKTTGGKDTATLRTKTATDNEKTRVVFDFELKNKYYRIDRTLAYQKSGNKNTTSGKVTLMEIVDGKEVVLALKEVDVKQKVEELLGLDDKQFCQIIILPQGKFKEFLLSKSSEKKETLRSLFDTYFYQSLADKLQDYSKKLDSSYKIKESKLATKFEQFSFYEELDEFEFLKEENLEKVSKVLKDEEETLKEEEKALALIRKEEKTLEEEYRALEKVNDEFDSLEKNKEELESLQENSSTIAKSKEIIEKLEELEKNKGRIEEYDRLTLRKEKNLVEANSLEKNSKDLSNKKEINKNNIEGLLVDEEKINRLKADLEKSRYFYSELERFRKAEEDSKKYSTLLEGLSSAKENLEKYKETLSSIAEELVEQQEEKIIVDSSVGTVRLNILAKENEVEKLEDYKNKEKNLNKEMTELAQTLEELRDYNKEKEILEEKVARLEKNEEQELLNKVLTHLHEGDSCPLCGQEITTLPELKNIEKIEHKDEVERLTSLNEKIIRLEALTNNKKDDLEARQKDLDAKKSTINEEAREQLASLNEEQTSLTKQLEEIKVTIEKLKNDKQTTEEKIKSFEQSLALEEEYKEKLLLATQTTKQYSENIAIPLVEFEDYFKKNEQEVKDFDAKKEKYEKERVELEIASKELEVEIKNNSLSLKELELDLNSLLEKYNTSKIKSFYANIEVAKNALADLEMLTTYKNEVEDYENKVKVVKEAIKNLETKLSKKTRPNMEEASSKLENKKDEVGNYLEKVAVLTTKLENNKKLYDEISTDFVKLQEKVKLSREVFALSDVVNGKTQSKKSLETYVQTYYLDLILEAASTRLLQMSEGRYSFSRKIEKARGGGLQGLDIEIFDIYMNAKRDVSSLSGGELFLSSLSLALGLAEVIQNQSGGISLETIFIDEGFGSLDAQTLDTAISTLIDLQSYGRNIGIISHVSELQERIRPKIEVYSKNNYAKVKISGI